MTRVVPPRPFRAEEAFGGRCSFVGVRSLWSTGLIRAGEVRGGHGVC